MVVRRSFFASKLRKQRRIKAVLRREKFERLFELFWSWSSRLEPRMRKHLHLARRLCRGCAEARSRETGGFLHDYRGQWRKATQQAERLDGLQEVTQMVRQYSDGVAHQHIGEDL